MMQMTSTARSLRPLLLGQNEDFETRIMKFLSILETSVDLPGSRAIPLGHALSYPAPTGQTLLHLASFLGFDTLVSFLVERGADLDARDRNGYTALHFAAIGGSRACTAALLHAGADLAVVNALGKTPREIAVHEGLFCDSEPVTVPSADDDDDDGEDDEAHWGDVEEDSDDGISRYPRRVVGRRSRRSTASGKRTPRHVITPQSSTSSLANAKEAAVPPLADDKQAATFLALIQRTLAQLPAPQLRNLPGLAQLPEIPAVPWGALPQLPVVFPVFVPWPAFLGGDAPGGEPREGDDETKGFSGVSVRAAQELRGTWEAWEKWLAVAIAGATARQQPEEAPPPMYTPRDVAPEPALEVGTVEHVVSPETPRETPSTSRHVSYDTHQPVTEQEVNAYAYVPAEVPKKRTSPNPCSNRY